MSVRLYFYYYYAAYSKPSKHQNVKRMDLFSQRLITISNTSIGTSFYIIMNLHTETSS